MEQKPEQLLSKNQLIQVLDIIAKSYEWVMYKGQERRWCTHEVAEFGGGNDNAYMTDEQFASLLYMFLFNKDKNVQECDATEAASTTDAGNQLNP